MEGDVCTMVSALCDELLVRESRISGRVGHSLLVLCGRFVVIEET